MGRKPATLGVGGKWVWATIIACALLPPIDLEMRHCGQYPWLVSFLAAGRILGHDRRIPPFPPGRPTGVRETFGDGHSGRHGPRVTRIVRHALDASYFEFHAEQNAPLVPLT
jgi:hypothetical protein